MNLIKDERIKKQIICCHTCTNICSGTNSVGTIGSTSSDCLVPTRRKIAIKIINDCKVWKSELYYEYNLWHPDIPKDSILPERLFEI